MTSELGTICTSMELTDQNDLLVQKIGTLLSSCPDVAQAVLRHMTLVELQRYSLVCRLWNILATKILGQRCVPHYTTFHDTFGFWHDGTSGLPYEVCPKLLCRSTVQKMTSRPDLCLVFSAAPDVPGYQNGNSSKLIKELKFLKDMMPPECKILVVCNLALVGTVEHDHKDTLDKLWQQACCCGYCPDPPEQLPSKRRRSSSSRLRQDSDFSLSSETEGNGTAVNYQQGYSSASHSTPPPLFGVGRSITVVQEMMHMKKARVSQPHFSMLCLPNNIPDVHFKFFKYITPEMDGSVDPGYGTQFSSWMDEEGPLRALLLFETSTDSDFTEAYTEGCILAALEQTDGRVAIGGTVNSTCHSDEDFKRRRHNNDSKESYAIAVLGTGVKVASVVLTPNINTLDQAVKELEKLKAVYDPSKRSLAFMLACIGRKKDWYGRGSRRRRHKDPSSLGYALPQAEVTRLQKLPPSTNVEVAMLRSLFPNTPVIGTFGYGEYCHAYQPRPGDQDDTVTKEQERALHNLSVCMDAFSYSYSTVVVFLQYDTL